MSSPEDQGPAPPRLTSSIRFNSLVLGLFALVTALLLATTYLGTRDTIAEAEREAAQRSLLEIFPPDSHDNDLLDDTIPVPKPYWSTLGLDKGGDIHVARRDGRIVGFIVPAVAPDGYNGDIRLLVGLRPDGTIAGVRVTSHSETPGLGDKVDLKISDWILGFNGKSLGNPPREDWAVKKDGGSFDQFTGATITPRAVVARVLRTLLFFRDHGGELVKAAKKATPAAATTTNSKAD